MSHICLIGMGGTISMTASAPDAGVAPTRGPGRLLADVDAPMVDIRCLSLAKKPSCDLTFTDILRIYDAALHACFEGALGIVVTTGTDTMEELAFALDMLWQEDNPIVVTGAMRAADAKGADGPANLAGSIATAASPEARRLGVLVHMDEHIHSARFVRKHATHGPAFASGDAGALGAFVEGRPHFFSRVERLQEIAVPEPSRIRAVALLTAGFDDDGRLVDAVVQAGFAALVVEGLGGGHVSSRFAARLVAVAKEIPVVLASRCYRGRVLTSSYGYVGGDIYLSAAGLISSGSLGGCKARVATALLLAQPGGARELARYFRQF